MQIPPLPEGFIKNTPQKGVCTKSEAAEDQEVLDQATSASQEDGICGPAVPITSY